MDGLDLPVPPQHARHPSGNGGGGGRNALLMDAAALALYPNVGKRRPGDVNWTTMTGQKCKVSGSSVNKGGGGGPNGGGGGGGGGGGASRAQARVSVECAGPALEWLALSDMSESRGYQGKGSGGFNVHDRYAKPSQAEPSQLSR